MKSKLFKVLLLIAVIISTNSCNNNQVEKLKEENSKLIEELNRKDAELRLLQNSFPVLFDNALIAEKKDPIEAISIYEQICKNDTLSDWSIFSEDRILELKEKTKDRKGMWGDLFLFDLFLFGAKDTLFLINNNSKCGEWGGDSEIIAIYTSKTKMLANYKKNIFDCDCLEKYYYKTLETIEKKGIEIYSKDEKLIKDCIKDLLNYRLVHSGLVSHAGTYKTVEIKTENKKPSLFITCYTDNFMWSKFQQLKKRIINN